MKRALLAAGAVLVLSPLAACSGGGEDAATVLPPVSGTPSVSASAGASTTPSPVGTSTATTGAAPVRPPEADEPTAAGAEAFVRYWFATFDQAYNAMDATGLLRLSEPGCQSCANFASDIGEKRGRGQRYHVGSTELRTVVAPAPDPTGVAVTVDYATAAVEIVDQAGSVVESQPVKQGTLRVELAWLADHWSVSEVVLS